MLSLSLSYNQVVFILSFNFNTGIYDLPENIFDANNNSAAVSIVVYPSPFFLTSGPSFIKVLLLLSILKSFSSSYA